MMKIIITWLHKNGKCRSWTNANPTEHAVMSLTVYADAVKRCAGKWGIDIGKAAETINKSICKEKKGDR